MLMFEWFRNHTMCQCRFMDTPMQEMTCVLRDANYISLLCSREVIRNVNSIHELPSKSMIQYF